MHWNPYQLLVPGKWHCCSFYTYGIEDILLIVNIYKSLQFLDHFKIWRNLTFHWVRWLSIFRVYVCIWGGGWGLLLLSITRRFHLSTLLFITTDNPDNPHRKVPWLLMPPCQKKNRQYSLGGKVHDVKARVKQHCLCTKYMYLSLLYINQKSKRKLLQNF